MIPSLDFASVKDESSERIRFDCSVAVKLEARLCCENVKQLMKTIRPWWRLSMYYNHECFWCWHWSADLVARRCSANESDRTDRNCLRFRQWDLFINLSPLILPFTSITVHFMPSWRLASEWMNHFKPAQQVSIVHSSPDIVSLFWCLA